MSEIKQDKEEETSLQYDGCRQYIRLSHKDIVDMLEHPERRLE